MLRLLVTNPPVAHALVILLQHLSHGIVVVVSSGRSLLTILIASANASNTNTASISAIVEETKYLLTIFITRMFIYCLHNKKVCKVG